MAILSIKLGGQGKTADGRLIQIAGKRALIMRGPIVQVSISVAQQISQQLVAQGKQVPAAIAGFGLLDTGATSTCVDEEAAKKLGLPVVNVVKMASASHADTMRNVYPITFEIAGLIRQINCPLAIGAPLACQGIVALIGRDVLGSSCLFYNGPNGEFTLSF